MLVCWGMFFGWMVLVTISLRGAYGGRPFAKLEDPMEVSGTGGITRLEKRTQGGWAWSWNSAFHS